MSESVRRVVRVGVIGLGGAARQMVPKFAKNPRFRVTGAADLDAEILGMFKRDFPEAGAWNSVEDLCASPDIDLVYIGTPTRLPREHAVAVLISGKHARVEKPMAVSLDDETAMVEAGERNGTLLAVNVKHSFE